MPFYVANDISSSFSMLVCIFVSCQQLALQSDSHDCESIISNSCFFSLSSSFSVKLNFFLYDWMGWYEIFLFCTQKVSLLKESFVSNIYPLLYDIVSWLKIISSPQRSQIFQSIHLLTRLRPQRDCIHFNSKKSSTHKRKKKPHFRTTPSNLKGISLSTPINLAYRGCLFSFTISEKVKNSSRAIDFLRV